VNTPTTTNSAVDTKTLTLTIDGQSVHAREGETVLEVARRQGIYIPALCYLPGMPAWGGCRLCLIEVEGTARLQTACTTWVAEGMVVHTNTSRVRSRRQSYLKMYLSDHNAYCEAPCTYECPLRLDIPALLTSVGGGNLGNAALILEEELPLTRILERLCPRYCETACRRHEVDEPLAICTVNRALADRREEIKNDSRTTLTCRLATGRRVAVIGAGPSGLSAAWTLRKLGHEVAVYSSRLQPGGILRDLVPEFRLPQDVLEAELALLWQSGIRYAHSVRLASADAASDLLAAGFDAVVVATADESISTVSAKDASSKHLLDGHELLQRQAARASLPSFSGKVAVVGQGPALFDVARAARRLGAEDVVLLSAYLSEDTPQLAHELKQAVEEGITVEPISAVKSIRKEDGQYLITYIKTDGTVLSLAVTSVVLASEITETRAAAAAPRLMASVSTITGRTPQPGVFVTLDPATWPKAAASSFSANASGRAVALYTTAELVVQAIRRGKEVALAVDGWLQGEDLVKLEEKLQEYAGLSYLEQLNRADDLSPLAKKLARRSPVWLKMGIGAEPKPRIAVSAVPVATRLASPTVETEETLPLSQAQEEAERCLQCTCPSVGNCELQKLAVEYDITSNELVTKGSRVRVVVPQHEHPFIKRDMERCIACGRCVRICREVAGPACYEFTGRGFAIKVDTPYSEPLQLAECISCGRCVSVCPTGALRFNERALLSFWVDEPRCITCGECVDVCPVEALAKTNVFEEAREKWLELVAKGSRLAPGHRMCAGCGAPIVVRQVLMALDTPAVVGAATGCLEVSTTIYPYTSWKDSYIHTAFENVAATISGVETAYRALKKKGLIKEDFRFIAFGGDGGTYDIGLQALSGAMERGHRMLYVCYDNGAYMNTGFQRSGATPVCAWTTTSPVGKAQAGKPQPRKNLTEIMIAHGLKYVAQASPHDPRDLVRKAAKALSVDGPTFLNVLSPCPRGWRADGAESIDLARQAVNTCYWPLFEYENGQYRLTYRPKKKEPLAPWLKRQGRFAHLFQPGFEEALTTIQNWVDEEWERLLRKCGEPSEAEWQEQQRSSR